MKLDRNINPDGKGKYALIKLRELKSLPTIMLHPVTGERCLLVPESAVDFGCTPDSEFFVIRTKDKYSKEAFYAYARAAAVDGEGEYSMEILQLAHRAEAYPAKQKPTPLPAISG